MSSTQQGPLVRMAHFVGDFGSPFYAEERQRDVWNEASAFGLQLAVWSALLVTTAAVWVVGAPSLPYVSVGLGLVGLVCTLTVAYAQRLGVVLTGRDRMLRPRMLPYATLVVVLVAGMLRAYEGPVSPSFVAGVATGASAAVLTAVWAARRTA